ncbi:DEAD/DEAH box helicase family protein [Pedobacter cryoconitis]|nr:DEAD/DEAH box helicase family protein [Pedobacter cryoconitis]
MKNFDTNRRLPSVIKTDQQTTYNYTLGVTDRLSKAFEVIPSNSIINKGRCGIGGTYLEIKANRNSIIIVPTHSIIEDKCYDEDNNLLPNYFVVRGSKKSFDAGRLKLFIESDLPKKKIFSTPAGIKKIMECGALQDDLYNNWFLLLDESHTAITDSFRADVLIPFQYLFNFKHAALISATPYRFSDNRFKSFDVHNIKFNNKIGTINVLSAVNVLSALYIELLNPDKFPGRVHIFLNSIKQIDSIIKMAELTECSIFCKESKQNKDKLDGLSPFIKAKPNEANYSKFNFYTSKYFEGWDLEDANSTTIIVSDYKVSTLKFGVSNKCIQAAGRNRKISHEILHITNDRQINSHHSFDELVSMTLTKAESAVRLYNEHLDDSQGKIKFSPDKQLKASIDKYSESHIKHEGSKASLDNFKVDQIVNEEHCNQEFNNITFIKEAWELMGYKTVIKKLFTPNIPTSAILRNKTHRINATLAYLEELDINSDEEFPKYKQLAKFLPIECESIRIAYYEIGAEVVKSLNGDMKAIRRKVLESQFEKKKVFISEEYFKMAGYDKQPNHWITETLDRIYSELGVLDPKKSPDTIMVAKAIHLKDYYTKVTTCKMDDDTSKNGYIIKEY